MAGIAGIARGGADSVVGRMLDTLQNRGPAGRRIVEHGTAILGVVWPRSQAPAELRLLHDHAAADRLSSGHYAEARLDATGVVLERDHSGVVPLYYGWADDGALCFASEVKALCEATRDVRTLPPGHRLVNGELAAYGGEKPHTILEGSAAEIAAHLRQTVAQAVARRLDGTVGGCWLSGGLDSSTIAALARPHVAELHTFVAGLKDAPDLAYAREGAAYLRTRHHEVATTIEELMAIMPDVVAALESFDALLVRSSLTNYLVAKAAADYVPTAFSGEAGDELFAGYDYLKTIPTDTLADELEKLIRALHNTAFQRVDRCAAAHGLVVQVPFADATVVDYARRIPVQYKIRQGIEKWILRQAMDGLLPSRLLSRPKAKFWQGTGLGDLIAAQADARVTDADFLRERTLPNGWVLNTKEELLYYRAFRDRFGALDDLSWMGRTKGAPVQ